MTGDDIYRGPIDENAWLAEMTQYLHQTLIDPTFQSPKALEHRLAFICKDVRRVIALKLREKKKI